MGVKEGKGKGWVNGRRERDREIRERVILPVAVYQYSSWSERAKGRGGERGGGLDGEVAIGDSQGE